MKANEFRIGNYVSFEDRIFKIDSIANVFPTLDTAEFGIGVVDWNNIKPVPLTEEWLLNFGFNKKVDEYVFQDYAIEDIHNGVTWILKEFDYDSVCFVAIGKGINYVHQLQNLYFALVGEELELKNK